MGELGTYLAFEIYWPLAVIWHRLFLKAKNKYEQPKSLAFWLCPLCPQMRSITCCSVTHLFLLFSLEVIHILRLNIFVLFLTHSPSMSAWIQYYSSKNWHFLNLLTCPRSLFPDVIYWWSLLRKCAAAKAKVKSFFPTILGACNAHGDARTRMYSTNLVFWYWLCAMFYVIWGNALRKWFKSCSYTHSAHRLIHTFGGSL